SPEHPLVDEITTEEQKEAVKAYKAYAAASSDIDRLSTTREKTGVFTGAYAINPITGKEVPIYIADYVLASYGTGAVMGVPSHDERDFAFANKYGLPITRVIEGGELPYTGEGVLVNSGKFDGMANEAAKSAIVAELNKEGMGELKVNYRMRDWLVSRQRYWGAPIPMIHCPHCGTVPVPEEDLPVLLPYDVDFTPDGTSPLLKHEGFMNVKCPVCGADAKRDPDTMDTFVCSSWYYLRYADNKNDKAAFDPAVINKLLPVDKYVGGAEHACMHLLYARFFTKALRDMGHLNFDEPFLSLVHQGTILGPDGEKMSKSRGNVISPDDYIGVYGSDVFRMYLMFGFNYVDGGPWSEGGIKAVSRFADRIERLIGRIVELDEKAGKQRIGKEFYADDYKAHTSKEEMELRFVLANTVMNVSADIDRFMFNTSIARLMELVNAMYRFVETCTDAEVPLLYHCAEVLVELLSPFAPHFAEELGSIMGLSYPMVNHDWPTYRKADLVKDVINLAVQVNGKVKGRIDVAKDAEEEEIKSAALSDEKVKEAIGSMDVKKVIVIKGRLVNIVAK
ncbi:MAG: leucine--tRNA ligase, partial [Clostridiales bacterium]|nr:leucine--tRNA ligase [Clostridiales bacterium]